ncbi:MAG: YeeE/YedE family protein [Betaproteobacteria bacterium]|nr:MAG: YeeE/YedE family protein [Betaproteobacteria bacterium]
MYTISSFLAGLVFGIGLIVSGMVSPTKVLGFLDLAGKWDPSLALVMAGAIAVGAPAFLLAALPDARHIDRRLVLGSVAFGVSWGLAGFCPGPAVAAVGAGQMKALLFIAAMVAGMLAFELAERARSSIDLGAQVVDDR